MSQIILSKDQILKIIQIYEHFKHIETFNVIVDGTSASVNFELQELNNSSTRFKPANYKNG